MKSLRDRVVVVTGAGSGIGRASALAYAAAGARVHLVDVREDRLAEVAAALGRPAGVHALDCTDGQAVEEMAGSIFALEGRVHVVQNGVGVLVAAPVERLTLEQWRRAVEANLWSVICGVHAFVPRMLGQGEPAHVVNVSSLAGLVGFPFTTPYCATKFAVVGLSEALSAELHGRGIGVTAVCPGAVRTGLVADGTLLLPGSWRRTVDLGFARFAARPEQVAAAILHAVLEDRPLVVPSLLGGQVWLLKRWADGAFREAARRIAGALIGRAGPDASGR